MKLVPCTSSQELVGYSIDWLRETIEDQGITDIYLPAGNSPIPIYKAIQEAHPQLLRGTRLIQVDDIIEGPKKGLFRSFFEDHLPDYKHQFHWITEPPVQGGAALLGIGVNGHVAFHEPSMPVDFAYGEVPLSERTCQTLGLEFGTRGRSYGLGHFLKCQRVLVIVSGVSKREVFQKVIAGDRSVPAGSFFGCEGVEFVYLVGEME